MEFYFEFFYIGGEMKAEDVDRKVILSHPRDNVATATSPISPGTLLTFSQDKKIIAKEAIPFAHKISLRKIANGGPVIKYGERIGRAIREIKPGEWVHIHNVAGERGKTRAKRIGHRA